MDARARSSFAPSRRVLLGAGIGAGLGFGLGAAPALAKPSDAIVRPPPISAAERAGRIAKAQRLLQQAGQAALIVEPGSTMIYFCGVRWSLSERPTLLMIPREGAAEMVTPAFEEDRLNELLAVPAGVRVWHEHDDPYALVADWLAARKLASGKLAFDAGVRHFVSHGILRAAPSASGVSGVPIVDACRMIKSPAEIALMQHAADITVAAYRHTAPRIERGMTPRDIGAIMNGATKALGGEPEFALILLGEASAYPHGSGKPQAVRDGEVVLMDCGCTFEGYQSDISRTLVFGEPTKRQRTVWDQMRRGQQIAFEAAQLGVEAGRVDDAVRRYYESLGYGPDYRLPGTSHRTGHGIGLDGHEPINLVRGETTRLAPGMCFSDEPGIYIPGEFGIRLEDCIHMTPQGPKWFSVPPASIDRPV